MTTPTKRTFGETLNTWVQTVGILIAAAWGVWTFYFKEVDAPKSAPVNISMNLQLKTLGVVRDKEEFVVVEMKVTATNASPRKIYLLRSAWIAMGAWTERRDKENDSFQQSADSALKEGTKR